MAAEVAANAGTKVEVMTPDRTFAPDIMAMNLVSYMCALQDKDVTFAVARRLLGVTRDGNRLRARIGPITASWFPTGPMIRWWRITAPC